MYKTTLFLFFSGHGAGLCTLILSADHSHCVYVGNLHKWAFVPRGCSVLWVHRDYQRDILPVVTSLYKVGDFDYNFSYQGTDDNSQYYTAKTALKFYQDIGGHVSYWSI